MRELLTSDPCDSISSHTQIVALMYCKTPEGPLFEELPDTDP